MDLQQARANMIEQQVRPWDVLDQRVLDVLAMVPRERYVLPEHRGIAFSDFELPIGYGQHMLKPLVDGRLLQALELRTTDRVLEIGTGSGYLTACLAGLASQVESIEIVPELASTAAARLAELGVANASVAEQDASVPWDAQATYDAIALTGSVMRVPEFYRDKLAPGGRMFVVVGDLARPTMDARLLTRVHEQEWLEESLFEISIDPLVNFERTTPTFVF